MSLLSGAAPKSARLRTDIRRLAERVAARHDMDVTDVLHGRARTVEMVRARRELWCLAIDTLCLGWSEAARVFQVDHTTVMGAWRKRQRELAAEFEHASSDAAQ